MGGTGEKNFKADDKADRKLTCPCWQERKSEILGLLLSVWFLIGDWSSPSSQECADSWEYCPSGQAGQGSRPPQKFTKKFSKDSNHDPKHKWDCHFLLCFHTVKKWGRNANYKVLCLRWKMEYAMYPLQVLTCKSKWELVASCERIIVLKKHSTTPNLPGFLLTVHGLLGSWWQSCLGPL